MRRIEDDWRDVVALESLLEHHQMRIFGIIQLFDNLMRGFPAWGRGFHKYEDAIVELDRALVSLSERVSFALDAVRSEKLDIQDASRMRIESHHIIYPPRWRNILLGIEKGRPFTRREIISWVKRAYVVISEIHEEIEGMKEKWSEKIDANRYRPKTPIRAAVEAIFAKTPRLGRPRVQRSPEVVRGLSELHRSLVDSSRMLTRFKRETESTVDILERFFV